MAFRRKEKKTSIKILFSGVGYFESVPRTARPRAAPRSPPGSGNNLDMIMSLPPVLRSPGTV